MNENLFADEKQATCHVQHSFERFTTSAEEVVKNESIYVTCKLTTLS